MDRPLNQTTCTSLVFALACILLVPAGLAAQEPPEYPDTVAGMEEREWSVSLTPYAWLASQATDVAGEALRQSFDDLISLTDVGFQGRFEARWRWLSLEIDGTYGQLGTVEELGPLELDLTVKQTILDLKLGAEVYDSRRRAQDGGVGIRVGLGARYWDNDVSVVTRLGSIIPGDPPVSDTISIGQAWWDPVAGLGLHFPVTRIVSFMIRGTVGGLGIGDASDYMWDGEVSALFRVGRWFLVSAGYRQLQYSRTEGEGEDTVSQTVSIFGPQIGLTIGVF